MIVPCMLSLLILQLLLRAACVAGSCQAAAGSLSGMLSLKDSITLNGVDDVSVAPDGKHVYAVAVYYDGIVYWTRNASTGALTGMTSIRNSTNLNYAHGVSVAPDGKHVYAVAYGSDSIVYWSRSSVTGVLTGMVSTIDSVNLDGAVAVSVAPDGKHVYAVAVNSDSIVYWTRNAATGALSDMASIRDSTNLNSANSVTVAPDGKHVYAVAVHSDSIVCWHAAVSTCTTKREPCTMQTIAHVLPPSCTGFLMYCLLPPVLSREGGSCRPTLHRARNLTHEHECTHLLTPSETRGVMGIDHDLPLPLRGAA